MFYLSKNTISRKLFLFLKSKRNRLWSSPLFLHQQLGHEVSLSNTVTFDLQLIPPDPPSCFSAASCVFMCVISCSSTSVCLRRPPKNVSALDLSPRSDVELALQLGQVGRGDHEHAAPPLQAALLVRQPKGLHELVDVDAAVVVAVDGDGQVGDVLVGDLHLQVDAQELPRLPEVLHRNEAWR